jgi:hypothetical protein
MGQSKGSLRGKFIAMSVYIKRTERSQINDLMPHLKLLEKQEFFDTKNQQNKKWFFEKINKTDRPWQI